MGLEKKKSLRRIEFTFTDDLIHPNVHVLYEVCVLEDGKLISKTNHREVKSLEEMKKLINDSELFEHPHIDLP